MSTNNKKIPFIFILFVITLIIIIKGTGVESYLDKERLQLWIKGFGSWGPLIYILVYAITPSLFLPGLPVTIAGGLAFGPFYGTIFALIGATIGASFPFLIARYIARPQIESWFGEKITAIDEGVKKRGWVYVAITRLIPIFPFNLLNYAFGLTKINFFHYIAASFIFMLPGTAAYVIFSSSIFDILRGQISTEFIIGILLIVIIGIIPLIYKKVINK